MNFNSMTFNDLEAYVFRNFAEDTLERAMLRAFEKETSEEVEALEGELEGANARIEELEQELKDERSENETLEDKLEKAEARISDLEEELEGARE